MAKSLGEEIGAALSNITVLIIKTDSKSDRTQLTRQQAQLAGQLQIFVDQTVDETLPEYEEATEALNEANEEAASAKRKLDKVASSIKKFATAIDKLESLAEKVT